MLRLSGSSIILKLLQLLVPMHPTYFRPVKKSAARLLLEEHGLAKTYPVPLEILAKKMGFSCYTFEPDELTQDVAGVVVYNKKEIWLNADDPPERQRFTLAHEIGHIHLHNKREAIIDFRKNLKPDVTDPKEVEANRFAADLLMDKEHFVHFWLDNDFTVESAASAFGVSRQAARIRARELKLI